LPLEKEVVEIRFRQKLLYSQPNHQQPFLFGSSLRDFVFLLFDILVIGTVGSCQVALLLIGVRERVF
jgi:hypothetical protein